MAEFVNSIGQVRGKFGNVVAYVRANGKNYCKGASISRKPSTEPQKQQAAAFAVAVQLLQELGGIGSIGVVQGMAHGAASFLIWIFTESQKRNSME